MKETGVTDRQAKTRVGSGRLEGMALVAIVGLALGIRLVAIVYASDRFQPHLTDWETMARSLVERGYLGMNLFGVGDPKPSSFMPPLYPLVLAAVIALGPQATFAVVRVIQAVVSALSCLVVYYIAREAFTQDKKIAFIAATASAVYPPFVGPVVETNTATFEVALLALTTYFLLQSRKRAPVRNLILAGIMLGLAALTKAVALIVLPAIFFWLWVQPGRPSLLRVVKPFGILLAAALITILPWTIRNYRVHHDFVLISTNGGLNFWIGNNEKASGEFISSRTLNPQLVEQALSMTEVESDRFFYRKGLEFIQTHPDRAIRLFGRKLLYSIAFRPTVGSTYTPSPAVALGRMLYISSYLLFMPFWMAGLLLSLRQWRDHILFYGFIAGYIAVNVAFFVGTRYRTPVDPYLLMFAALAAVSLWTRLTAIASQVSARSGRSS